MTLNISRDDFFLPSNAPLAGGQLFLVYDEDADMGPTVHTYAYISHDEKGILAEYQGGSFLPNDEEHDWEGAGVSMIIPPMPGTPTHRLPSGEPSLVYFRARLPEDMFYGDPEVENLFCTEAGLKKLIDWIEQLIAERELSIPPYEALLN